jgi:hypothetical protein
MFFRRHLDYLSIKLEATIRYLKKYPTFLIPSNLTMLKICHLQSPIKLPSCFFSPANIFLKGSSNHEKRICVAPNPAGLAAKDFG